MKTNPKRARRQPRRVRPHASGGWTVCIGKALTRDRSKLRPKDWYWQGMGEAEANAEAARVQGKWDFLCQHWGSLYAPNLTMIGSPFADVPHWQSSDPLTPAVVPTQAEIDAYQNKPPTALELADAYADATLKAVFSLYKMHQQIDTAQGERQNVTRGAIEKNVRNALSYFPDPLRMDALTFQLVQTAKGDALTKLGRRTVKNYFGALKTMLTWFYASDYGKAHEQPSHFATAFNVRDAVRTDVTTHGAADLKAMLYAASDRTRLYAMLALNCGMYQADIGRLTLDEIDLDNGYVYWDRSKEPQNPFRVRHDLWAETISLARRFIQDRGGASRPFIDYRDGKPTEIDCATLAFVDRSGLPLYRVRESGDTYDKISEAWKDLKRKLPTVPRFKDVRKSTNQLLCERLELLVGDDDAEGLTAVGEISKMFLAQKTPMLARLYRQNGQKVYGRMNRYLADVGNQLRADGVLSLPDAV